jgi:predicted nucleic-acid-binding Zn-ribbon protein
VSQKEAASNVAKENTTYQSTKTAWSASGKEFSKILRIQVKKYYAHVDRAITVSEN